MKTAAPEIAGVSLENALRSASETRALALGAGVIAETVNVFREQFGERPVAIVADANTWAVAGEQVQQLFARSGHELVPTFVFSDPDLYAEFRFVERLEDALRSHSAIPV